MLNGANAGDINLVAPDKKITITGDVHAKEINVGGRTGTLQLDFPKRDFTTNYTNIKEGIYETTEFLELFLRNLLLSEKNVLHNREMHVSGKFLLGHGDPINDTINLKVNVL